MPFQYGSSYKEERHEELRGELDELLAEFRKDQDMPRLTGRQLLRLMELIGYDQLEDDDHLLHEMEKLVPTIYECALKRLAYERHLEDMKRVGPLYLPRCILECIEEERLRYEPENVELQRKIEQGLRQHDNIGRNRPQMEQDWAREMHERVQPAGRCENKQKDAEDKAEEDMVLPYRTFEEWQRVRFPE